ncbi:HpcH/HpaI aldolase family protein [Lichenibacterium ramalinae]|uniref:2,4-dihydroxyhept-2-ene-1,7-dioic acid aldolase n=1 Tax=Lichenibacterium ramalinae TaxID=2316527 RepID=A0A4Q2R9P6_9HYPH|nr:aldolase/citrate lyase family protein [Lichenibacterium ramalinae]RYB02659.1 2,4-dihydroxyhept-2-ene-1,7-dioic acid aldolase [Lichenibacterium ramalinae]
MEPQSLKALWTEGRAALNGWLSIGDAFAAEIVARGGYDSVTIDLQHGMIDDGDALAMIQALRASGAAPLVRVPWLAPAPIMRALDMGAVGVVCPMVETAAQAAELVSYVRYPPAGTRSFGPTRAAIVEGAGYGETADARVICFAMIETARGFGEVDAIAATPGLDGLYIGPADLTLALTGRRFRTGFDREEPEMLDAIRTILGAAKRAGIRAALHCGSPAYAARAIGWGFDLVTLPNDVRILARGAAADVAAVRAALASPGPAA